MQRRLWYGAAAVVCVILVAVLASRWPRDGKALPGLRMAKVSRGDLLVTVDATGTVEPEEVIDVGAQVAGRITAFGTDAQGRLVDYGSRVEKGTVLARIDDALFGAEVEAAGARLAAAKAGMHKARAELDQLRARLFKARRDWQRAQQLHGTPSLAATAYDAFKAAFLAAKADLAVGKASVKVAAAKVAQAEAELARAQRNLSYCTITSPVRGVVIDRRVNIGQTVVASLNAPSLFLIAKDLTRIQVWVAVNEADIGRIQPGQPVSFTVDALPGESFRGKVNKIRLNAAMTQNVVTYTVEVATDNPDGRLLPYLTANVRFELAHRSGVLLVPNAALRFTPQPAWTTTRQEELAGPALWVVADRKLRPLPVTTGASNGVLTEVSGTGVHEGLAVVVGILREEASRQTATPFTPRFLGRKAGGSKH